MAVAAVVSPTALTHPLKPAEAVSERSTYPRYAFPSSTYWSESFGHKSTPFYRPWTEAYYAKF